MLRMARPLSLHRPRGRCRRWESIVSSRPCCGSPLVAQLRKRREAAGVSREEAAYLIRSSGAKISRMELGRHRFKERDLIDLLVLYGAEEADRAQFSSSPGRPTRQGWWQRYEDLLPPWFETYVAMEQAASVIRTYEMQFVPGLLQTNEYTRAVIRLAHSKPEEVERRVDLRRRRQEVLTSSNAPQVWAVIDEAALHRPPGAARCAGHRWSTCSSSTSCQHLRADRHVQPRCPSGDRRAFHHPALPRAGPARRGVPRTSQRRALSGQGLRCRGLRRPVASTLHPYRSTGTSRSTLERIRAQARWVDT